MKSWPQQSHPLALNPSVISPDTDQRDQKVGFDHFYGTNPGRCWSRTGSPSTNRLYAVSSNRECHALRQRQSGERTAEGLVTEQEDGWIWDIQTARLVTREGTRDTHKSVIIYRQNRWLCIWQYWKLDFFRMSVFTYSLLAGFSLFAVSAALFALPWMGNWPQSWSEASVASKCQKTNPWRAEGIHWQMLKWTPWTEHACENGLHHRNMHLVGADRLRSGKFHRSVSLMHDEAKNNQSHWSINSTSLTIAHFQQKWPHPDYSAVNSAVLILSHELLFKLKTLKQSSGV